MFTSCLVTPIRLRAFTHKIRSPATEIFIIINDVTVYTVDVSVIEVFGQMTTVFKRVYIMKRIDIVKKHVRIDTSSVYFTESHLYSELLFVRLRFIPVNESSI